MSEGKEAIFRAKVNGEGPVVTIVDSGESAILKSKEYHAKQ